MIINRRRTYGKYNPYDQYGYIRKGLVFHLDGIDKGDIENKWSDLIGEYTFPFNGVSTILEDGIQFNGGSTEWMLSEQTLTKNKFNQNICTIECCFNRTSGNIIFAPTSTNIMFGCGESYYHFYSINTSCDHYDTFSVNTIGPHTVSCSANMGIVDNLLMIKVVGTSYAPNTSGYISIGARQYGNHFPFKGILHSIRIYNRFLTPEEILNNQRIDNQRFNLGIDKLDYDSEIEYLKCSGTQYINTGILSDNTTKIELKGEFKYNAATTRFGSRAGTTSLQFDVITGSDNKARIDFGTGNTTSSQWTVGQHIFSTIIIDASTKKATIEYGGNIATHTYTSSFPSQSSYPLTLFAFNNAGNILLASDMTVSSFRCWKSDTLVMDMIPVRVGTTGYMYDRVSKLLFGNDGSGEFILGLDKLVPYDSEIEYLETDGKAYIDLKLNNSYNRAYAGKYYSPANSDMIWSTRYNENKFGYYLRHGKNADTYVRVNENTYFFSGSKDTEIHEFKFDLYNNYVIFDEVRIDFDPPEQLEYGQRPEILFKYYNGNIANNYDTKRIYWTKYWEADDLIRDLIPVRIGNVGYMYDKVSGRLFGNIASGAFILGPDK